VTPVSPMVGVVVAAVLLALHLYRSRRLAPDVPRGWRTSQAVAARLCRRVHRAVDNADSSVRRARKRGVAVVCFEGAVSDLRSCASTIDHQLVAASELPLAPRHRTLLELRYRIADVEKAAARVVTMAGEAGRPAPDEVRESVEQVHQRLDDLESARRELRELG
jgi:hypothetical protein